MYKFLNLSWARLRVLTAPCGLKQIFNLSWTRLRVLPPPWGYTQIFNLSLDSRVLNINTNFLICPGLSCESYPETPTGLASTEYIYKFLICHRTRCESYPLPGIIFNLSLDSPASPTPAGIKTNF